jgi:hypothetical protein
MIRDFTKSAMSFSWALSLLGVKQAANLLRPAQQRGSDLLAPIIQVAVDQLDDSMKNIYRSGDSLQARAVDLVFVWINPMNWIDPKSWTGSFGGDCGQQQTGHGTSAAGHSSGNGFTHAGYQTNDGPAPGSDGYAGQRHNAGQNSANRSAAPVSNDSAAVGWGPMPVDS